MENLQSLLLLAILLVLIFILIRFYPVFHILLSKLFFGKFSTEYINTYKKYTNRSPFSYCMRDDFINHITGFFKIEKDCVIFNSDSEIKFGESDFFSDQKKILIEKGKPFCVNVTNLDIFNIKVFGYRDELFSSEMKLLYFFMNNKFFMGEYSLKNTKNINIEEISRILIKKYNCDKMDKIPEKFIIQGKNKVKILVENTGFRLAIRYLNTGNQKINELLDEFWNSSTYKSLTPHSDFEMELMDKL